MKFEDIYKVKSSTGMIKYSADMFKAYALKENEEFDGNPSGLFSTMVSTMGDIVAANFFERSMYIREINPSTMVLQRSALRHLDTDDISNVYGTPSSCQFSIAFPENALMDYAVTIQSSNGILMKKITLNKNVNIKVADSPDFTLDHNIDITVLINNEDNTTTYKAAFDLSDKYSESLSEITNAYLQIRTVWYNGLKYLVIDVPTRQYLRTYHGDYIITSTNLLEYQIPFADNLMGFEVLYKESGSSTFRLMKGEPEGIEITSGYNYTLDTNNGNKLIKINFSSHPNAFKPSLRSTIQIVVYSTTGSSGNISFPGINDDVRNLILEFKQDISNPYQNALNTLQLLVATRQVEATGGANAMTFEELRNYIIYKSSDNIILSTEGLVRLANSKGATIDKKRHDVVSLLYSLVAPLTDDKGLMIRSGTENLEIALDDVDLNTAVRGRIIEPTTVYYNNLNDTSFKLKKNPMSFTDYIDSYKTRGATQAIFPFFISISANKTMEINIYDCGANDVYYTEIENYSDVAKDSVSVNNILVYRNPLDTKYSNQYSISFQSLMGSTIYNELVSTIQSLGYLDASNSTLKFRLIFTNKLNGRQYSVDADFQLGMNAMYADVSCILPTNNNLLDDCVGITGFTLQNVPSTVEVAETYYLEDTIDISICIMFKSANLSKLSSNAYMIYMTAEEIANDWYIPTVYKVENINLMKNLTSDLYPNMDLKVSEVEYAKYEQNIYKKYENDVYKTDSEGNMVVEIFYLKKHNIDSNPDEDPYMLGQIISEREFNSLPSNVNKDNNYQKFKDYEIIHRKGDVVEIIVYTKINNDKYGSVDDDYAHHIDDGYKVGDVINSDIYDSLYEKTNKANNYEKKITYEIEFAAGDYMLNSKNQKIETTLGYTYILKDFVWIDRISATQNNFFSIRNAYYRLLDIASSVKQNVPDNISFTVGANKVTGKSEDKYFITRQDQEEPAPEYLSDISISISFGVKFNDDVETSVMDSEVESMISRTQEYIESVTDLLAVDKLFEYLKELFPSINYLTHYTINDYDTKTTQVIEINKASESFEILNVRYEIDEDNLTKDNSGNVIEATFKPAISIKIL